MYCYFLINNHGFLRMYYFGNWMADRQSEQDREMMVNSWILTRGIHVRTLPSRSSDGNWSKWTWISTMEFIPFSVDSSPSPSEEE